jgi:arsenate reductase
LIAVGSFDHRRHPETLRLLQSLGYDTSGFCPKSWDEFAAAPKFDTLFSLSATTRLPKPGQPVTAHWGVPDPA